MKSHKKPLCNAMYLDCAGFGTIMETEEPELSPVTDACQQLTEGLLALAARDNVPLTSAPDAATAPAAAAVPFSSTQSMPPFIGASTVSQPAVAASGVFPGQPTYNMGVVAAQPMSAAVGSPFVVQPQQSVNAVALNHSGLHHKLF